MFLRGVWTLPSFIIGFFWGAVLLFVFRRFFHRRFYLHKVYAIIKLLFIFIRELFKANIAVTKDVLRPKLNIQPAIFAMPTRLESEWEITILSLLITLTPGTLVMDVSDDNSTNIRKSYYGGESLNARYFFKRFAHSHFCFNYWVCLSSGKRSVNC
jgi:multicomponent Na+:H+ antiporter subunit E